VERPDDFLGGLGVEGLLLVVFVRKRAPHTREFICPFQEPAFLVLFLPALRRFDLGAPALLFELTIHKLPDQQLLALVG
jgi:hypothetical protein